MPWALPFVGLDVLLIVLWTIAAALAIAYIMTKVGDSVRGITGIGPPIANAMDAVGRAISNACGHLMSGIESLVGAALHWMARQLDHYLEQFVAHASLIYHLAELVGGALYRVSGLKALVHQVATLAHTIAHSFVVIGRELYHLGKRVAAIERQIAKGIGADVLPEIKSLDRELHALERAVPADIAAAEAQAASAIADLRAWISRTIPIPGTDAFTAAIAVALGALGLGGLRCNSLLSSLAGRGCGLWQGLEDILGLLFDAVIFTDLCGWLPEAEALFGELEAPLVSLVASAADAACAHPPAGWTELSAPALSLPSVYYTGPVPGN